MAVDAAPNGSPPTAAHREIARRVEYAQAAGTARAVQDLGQAYGDAAYDAFPFAGGWVVLAPKHIPLWGAKGLGFAEPIRNEMIDAVEERMRWAGLGAAFYVSPLADPGLATRLAGRGYRAAHDCEVWIRGTASPLPSLPSSPGIEISAVDPEDEEAVETFAATVASGYVDGEAPTSWNRMIGRNAARRPTRTAFLAHVDGHVAGGGVVGMNDGLASFTFMSTLPPYRRQGVQGALMRARFAHAQCLGADLVCVQCMGGSATARNAARLGFERIYTRAVWAHPEG